MCHCKPCPYGYLLSQYPLCISGKEWGFDGSQMFAHSGMLEAARWIRTDLRDNIRLSELMSNLASSPHSQNYDAESKPFEVTRLWLLIDMYSHPHSANLYAVIFLVFVACRGGS